MLAAQSDDPERAFAELEATRPNTLLEVMRRQPIYYKANRFAVTGPNTGIVWPANSRPMYFELELACVIARRQGHST